MSRQFTAGFEMNDPRGIEVGTNGTAAFQQETVRTGAWAGKVDTGAGGAGTAGFFSWTFSPASSTSSFLRFYMNFSSFPSATNSIFISPNPAETAINVTLTTSNTLRFNGVDSAVLATGIWYRIEYKWTVNASAQLNGAMELQVDGVSVSSFTNSGTTRTGNDIRWGIGVDSAAQDAGIVAYCDDCALNISSGSSQTSYPGNGRVFLLSPISDNARGANWTGGAGGTTNLWDAVDNKPPVGVALASATDTSQIKNVAKDATGNYDANMTSYTTAGILASDTINVVHPFWLLGGPATGTAFLLVSNPQANGGTASTWGATSTPGTYPSGWSWQLVAAQIVYSPSVTLGTSPVMRVGKRQNSTNACECAGMFVYVDISRVEVTARFPRNPAIDLIDPGFV